MTTPSHTGRWTRWAVALGVVLGLGIITPPDASADARHRKPHRPAVVATHGRAQPVAVRKRGRLAPPAIAQVAIGPLAFGDLTVDETPAPRKPALAPPAATAAAIAIDKLLRGPLRHGTTALYVVDAATGRELFSLRPDERLNPASNVKMISTAAALDLLGPDFQYRTRLLGPGPDAAGLIDGDVYLHGSYDPTLGESGLEDLAAQVAAGGVKTIHGDVLVGSVATRDGLYRSKIHVDVVATAAGAAPRVDVTPASDFVEVVNLATTGKRPKVKGRITVGTEVVTRTDGHTRLVITVRGLIGKGKHTESALFTKERHFHAAHVLRAALRRHGVELTGDVAIRALPAYVDGLAAIGRLPIALGENRSAALGDIVAQVNKRSINWLSDRIIATAALTGHDDLPSVAHGVDAMYAWLDRRTGIGRGDAFVDTGSGLSHRTQLSARQLVGVLRTAAGFTAHGDDDARIVACAQAFTHSLSVAGVDGTLRGRFRADGLRGRVIGKTGTLRDSIALSGLLTGADDRRIAFSLVTNGHDSTHKRAVRAGHEAVLEILDHYLAATATARPAIIVAAPVVATVAAALPAADPAAHEDSDEEGSDPDDDD